MLIISALQPSFMHLVDELNGNHVIHKCLSNFGAEENKNPRYDIDFQYKMYVHKDVLVGPYHKRKLVKLVTKFTLDLD